MVKISYKFRQTLKNILIIICIGKYYPKTALFKNLII